ncbi:MAG: metallophosphoesterase [Desulfobacteraceae bacterium]|nr:metallophosphoesterase [Desulfobacteraceae bacterium]
MAKFIHISDLHIHKDNDKEDNRNCRNMVRKIVSSYAVKKPVVLISGDIVDDGHEEQYKNAVEILSPLVDKEFNVLAAPGNHDYGPLGNFYTEESQMFFQKYILGELLGHSEASQDGVTMEKLYPMTTSVDNTLFIGIDSVVGAEDELLHFASGEVGINQRNKLQDILHENRNSGKNIVVYFHHHPFNRKFVMEMDDAKEVLRLLAGKIDILCFGHDHESEAYNDKHNIDWMLASGKSPKRNRNNKFQFREINIEEDGHSVAMVSFTSD